jgi:hypothetical protein
MSTPRMRPALQAFLTTGDSARTGCGDSQPPRHFIILDQIWNRFSLRIGDWPVAVWLHVLPHRADMQDDAPSKGARKVDEYSLRRGALPACR